MRNLRELIASVLQVETSEILDDSSPQTIGTWDSFSGLMLVSELEEAYQVKFSSDEISAVKCVTDIKKALRNHGVKDFE